MRFLCLLPILVLLVTGCAASPAARPRPAEPPAPTAAEPAPPASPLDVAVRQSYLHAAFEALPSAIRIAVEAAGEEGDTLIPERVAALDVALNDLWQEEQFVARARWSLERELSPEEIEQLATAIGSGREQALIAAGLAVNEVEQATLEAFAPTLAQVPAERTELFRRYVQATGLLESGATLVAMPVHASLEITNALRVQAEQQTPEEIKTLAKQIVRDIFPPEMAQVLIIATAYALRDVADAQLEQSVAFWETELAQRYRKALLQGLVLGVQVSTGQTLQKLRGEPITIPPELREPAPPQPGEPTAPSMEPQEPEESQEPEEPQEPQEPEEPQEPREP